MVFFFFFGENMFDALCMSRRYVNYDYILIKCVEDVNN